MPRLHIYLLFLLLKQQIPKFSQHPLPYSTIYQILENWRFIAANYVKNVTFMENSIVIFDDCFLTLQWYVTKLPKL